MSPIRIIIAEGHLLVRQALRSLFNREPWANVVAEAADGRSAVGLAAELRPGVVVMEVAMRELDGIEAARRILGQNPTTKVVALTAHSGSRRASEMLAAGATGYVLKDAPFSELAKAVRMAAEGRMYLAPRVAAQLVEVERDGGGMEWAPVFTTLSPRERQILKFTADGMAMKQMAVQLGLSVKSIEGHRRSIMDKLKVYTVAELTKYALREGLSTL